MPGGVAGKVIPAMTKLAKLYAVGTVLCVAASVALKLTGGGK